MVVNQVHPAGGERSAGFHAGLDPRSLFIFKLQNPVRAVCLKIKQSVWFDGFILLAICINSIFLALDRYDLDPASDTAQSIFYAEWVFLVIFALELVIKVIALGLVLRPKSYLRDGWNWLDFLVVVFSIVSVFGGENISAVRMFRVLRPLRAVKKVPGMRIIVSALISSLPHLRDVAALAFFLISLFGILGVQLYGGKFGNSTTDNGYTCPSGSVCLMEVEAFNNGYTSFDNILLSWVVIVQVISLEGWSDVMFAANQIDGSWNQLYFVTLVMIGSYFVINLVTAVVYLRFDQLKKSEKKKNLEKRLRVATQAIRFMNKTKLAAGVKTRPLEPASTVNNVLLPPNQSALEQQHQGSRRAKCARVHKIVHSRAFNIAMVLTIIINTFSLAADHEGISSGLKLALDVINSTCLGIFIIEMVLKHIVLRSSYWKDASNAFDGIIVFTGLVEIAVGDGSGFLTVLRTFRLLRVLKLISFSKRLRNLIRSITLSAKDLSYFTLIVILFIYIFSVLGMQTFGGKYKGVVPRANFNSFGWSTVTVFQIITGENWNEVMYSSIAAIGWGGGVFCIFLFLFGNYILLSLFLAIMLGNFDVVEQIVTTAVVPLPNEQKQAISSEPALAASKKPESLTQQQSVSLAVNPTVSQSSVAQESTNNVDSDGVIVHPFTMPCCRKAKKNQVAKNNLHDGSGEWKSGSKGNAAPTIYRQPTLSQLSKRSLLDGQDYTSIHNLASAKTKVHNTVIRGKALGFLPSSSKLRKFCMRLTISPAFEGFIFLLIILSNLALALDTPGTDPDSDLGQALFYSDVFFTTAFAIEMVVKILGLGLVMQKQTYFRSGWNILDFVLVVTSVLNLSLSGTEILQTFRVLRALRALRVLRMVSHNERLALVVRSVVSTIGALGNVLIVAFIFFTIFAILGVQLFKGKMMACYDTSVSTLSPSIIYDVSYKQCTGANKVWQRGARHYDYFGASLLSMFEVATLEMWPSIMNDAIDARSNQLGARQENDQWAALFFIAFIIIGSLVVVGIFVGVVVTEYNKQHSKFSGSNNLTEAQTSLLKAYKEILDHPPITKLFPPKTPMFPCANKVNQLKFRGWFFDVVTHSRFELFIMVSVFCNILLQAITHEGMSQDLSVALTFLNDTFSFLFLFEMFAKWIGLGFRQYFVNRWNIADFVIVLIFVVSLGLDLASGSGTVNFDPTIFRTFRVLRVMRVFRLVRRAKSLRQLIQTLLFSLPALYNVGSLLFLFFFMYAILGMSLFGEYQPSGQFLNENSNFSSFPKALIVLFQMSTGESWNGMFREIIAYDPSSFANIVAVAYFTSFIVLSAFLLLNVFVAVIVKNFEHELAKDADNIKDQNALTTTDFIQFSTTWNKHSNGTFIRISKLKHLLISIPGKMRLPKEYQKRKDFFRFMREFNIPQHNGKVHWVDVQLGLVAKQLGMSSAAEHGISSKNEMLQGCAMQARSKYPDLKKCLSYTFTAGDYFAAEAIQRWWKISRIQKNGGVKSKKKGVLLPPKNDATAGNQKRKPR